MKRKFPLNYFPKPCMHDTISEWEEEKKLILNARLNSNDNFKTLYVKKPVFQKILKKKHLKNRTHQEHHERFPTEFCPRFPSSLITRIIP